MRVEDTAGRKWIVKDGDPAKELVDFLGRRGFRYTVLPFQTLASGTVEESEVVLPEELPEEQFARLYQAKQCGPYIQQWMWRVAEKDLVSYLDSARIDDGDSDDEAD